MFGMESCGKSSRRQQSSSVLCALLLILQWSCYASANESTTEAPISSTAVISTTGSESVSTVEPSNSANAEITSAPTNSVLVTDDPIGSSVAVTSTSPVGSVTTTDPASPSSESHDNETTLLSTAISSSAITSPTANTSSATVKESDPIIHSSPPSTVAPTQFKTVSTLPTVTSEESSITTDKSSKALIRTHSAQEIKSPKVLPTLIVLGCLLGIVILLAYYFKNKQSWSPKSVRLVETGPQENDCHGNTAMSDVPREPSVDAQSKPKLNGENQSTASGTGNGHQKKMDETDTEV
ncbi:mucin-5AC-like [Callorhinchus milii]|uniref:mucin-5AC-like n=1 Tax=Callorhinchus milii TaxID=7868 RepID=UPI0004575642|nr:mucin-5AC-like [Callorhinchus milii]|eukprot:gi/632963255/ref/XP_007897777.1/ PREDICTED: A-agglutinin anchorage subunit-like isoform X2 [Callorhinchus milii]